MQKEQQTEEVKLKKKEEVRAYQPTISFPQMMQKSKMDEQFAKFLNMFKKIEVNIPFAKALAQMPHYAKFMKDILSKKRKLDEERVVSLSTTCNIVIQKNLPWKMQDLGSFTIPCTIADYELGKALCSKHQLNAIICSKETKFGGAYSYNYDSSNGRHNYDSTRGNPRRCIDQGGKIFFPCGLCCNRH